LRGDDMPLNELVGHECKIWWQLGLSSDVFVMEIDGVFIKVKDLHTRMIHWQNMGHMSTIRTVDGQEEHLAFERGEGYV